MDGVWPHSPCRIWKSCTVMPMKHKVSTMDSPCCNNTPSRLAPHSRWKETVTGPICMGGDIENPVGHMLFGDSATPVRATIRQKELLRPPIGCSSCSVNPQCLPWKQQSNLGAHFNKKEAVQPSLQGP